MPRALRRVDNEAQWKATGTLTYSMAPSRSVLKSAPKGDIGFMTEGGETKLNGGQHVFSVLELAKAGKLDRLRFCASAECRRWFARAKNKLYCGGACRRHAFRTSPEQRKKNADYHRWYYHKYLSSGKASVAAQKPN